MIERVHIFERSMEALYDRTHEHTRRALEALERKENIEALKLKAAADISASLTIAHCAMLEICERLKGVRPPKIGE